MPSFFTKTIPEKIAGYLAKKQYYEATEYAAEYFVLKEANIEINSDTLKDLIAHLAKLDHCLQILLMLIINKIDNSVECHAKRMLLLILVKQRADELLKTSDKNEIDLQHQLRSIHILIQAQFIEYNGLIKKTETTFSKEVLNLLIEVDIAVDDRNSHHICLYRA